MGAAKRPTQLVRVRFGPINIAYFKENKEWWAVALEFDILGSGKTRQAALSQLKELVNFYFLHTLKSEGNVSFYNPSDRELWDLPDKEKFDILVCLQIEDQAAWGAGCKSLDLNEMRPFAGSVKEFALAPACA